jgi:hypothetical protein
VRKTAEGFSTKEGHGYEPLSITLAYPLTIHRVLATLGRHPNLMEPAIPSEELDGGVFDGGESRTLDYCEQGYYLSEW